jgi:hypothetical protein
VFRVVIVYSYGGNNFVVVRKSFMMLGINLAFFHGEPAASVFGLEERSKVEVTDFSETPVNFCQATLRQAPEDGVHSHRQS